MVAAILDTGANPIELDRAIKAGEYDLLKEQSKLARAVMVASLPDLGGWCAETSRDAEAYFGKLVAAYFNNEERPALLNRADGFRFSDEEQARWDKEALLSRVEWLAENTPALHAELEGHTMLKHRRVNSKDGRKVNTTVHYELRSDAPLTRSYVGALRAAVETFSAPDASDDSE